MNRDLQSSHRKMYIEDKGHCSAASEDQQCGVLLASQKGMDHLIAASVNNVIIVMKEGKGRNYSFKFLQLFDTCKRHLHV